MRPAPLKRIKRRHHRIAAWFGILALALPMLAPLAQAIPLSAPKDGTQAPFYLVLCKAMQNGTSGPDQSPDQNPDLSGCPVCLSLSFGKALLFTSLISEPFADIRPLAQVITVDDEIGHGHVSTRAHARAPPLFV